MLTSTSTFVKDVKIALARRAKCNLQSLKKLQVPIAREIMVLLVSNVDEKTSQKVTTDAILKACARYL